MFVTFEGLDGCGKSTQVELLAEHLRAAGREVVATREPGGTPLGEKVRALVLDGDDVSGWAEAALFAAARAELVERVIRPALARGADVLCDRYVDSSLAYQGIARGLGLERVLDLNLAAVGGLLPQRTFLLRIHPDVAARRTGDERDRIEREDPAFHGAVDAAYADVAAAFPERIVELDAARAPEQIAAEIRGLVRELS